MIINRRKLLAGGGASLIAPKKSKAFFTRGVPAALSIKFQQAALGGGGFAFELKSCPDGSMRFMRGDTPNFYGWDSTSGLFKNYSVSPNMDQLGISVKGFDRPYAIACAPDNQRVYMITGVLPGRIGLTNSGGGEIGINHGQLYRSDDRGATWFKPGSANPATDPLTTPFSFGANGHFYQGPLMTVDPNNKDVVYYMGWNGSCWVTHDGGVTWTQLITLMRAALPHGLTTANTLVGGNTITMGGGCPIAGATAGVYAAFDSTHPFALGGSNGGDDVSGVPGATSFVAGVQKNDGTQSVFNDPGVVSGDEIFFGKGCGVVVDGSSGTTVVGGVTCSSVVYFAWAAGPSTFFMTTDGAQTFSAMTGGPTTCATKIKISNDGVLYVGQGGGGANPYWRWVKTPPAGSGLAANTWTNLPVNPADGALCMCPDPLQPGKVVYMSIRGHTFYSTDYGTTNSGAWGAGYINSYTQAPWLTTDDWEMSDAEFDPVVSNKLWISDGIGVLTNFPFNNANQPTMAFAGQNLQSLIVGSVLKVPSPGNVIVLGQCQDRSLIVCQDINTVPDGYFPGTGVGNTAGVPCYSLDDPTKVFAPNSNDIVQYQFSSTGHVQNWTAITSSGVNGWPVSSPASTAMVASKTTSQLFIAMNNVNLLFGTRSGATWTWANSLFGGNPVVGKGTFPTTKTRMVSIDNVNGTIYYYDFTAKTLYISTDGGATLTSPGGAGTGPAGGIGCKVQAVHGNPNHVFVAFGVDGGGSLNPPSAALHFTKDGGVTWTNVANTNYINSVCVGPISPGATYPTIHIIGRLSTSTTFQYSVYRCTDFNPNTASGTWVDIGANLKKVNCEGFQGGIYEDPEMWSSFYMATDDTGYVKGFLA